MVILLYFSHFGCISCVGKLLLQGLPRHAELVSTLGTAFLPACTRISKASLAVSN
jgi:hypothetical protein